MYWDIVEVVPKAGYRYRLFVRFKDGSEGLVHLHREQLTGALEPLPDERFFQQVFIDHGAVAWPGEIDLAPDTMYAQVVGKQKGTEARVSGCSALLQPLPPLLLLPPAARLLR